MTIIAAAIAAVVVVSGYWVTHARDRRERRATAFADALAAVEEYLEAPYRIRRRRAATPEVRDGLAMSLSDLQTRIARHRSWLRVEAPLVADAYDALVAAARLEAGVQMTEAWNSAPPATDADMNLRVAYQHPRSDAERDKVIAAMGKHLKYMPSIRSSWHKTQRPDIRSGSVA